MIGSMVQRRFHYDRAFEAYLRSRRVPYVAVDEAKKALLPRKSLRKNLKSFDFVIYGKEINLIVDVKGRRFKEGSGAGTKKRLECWVTRDDVESLSLWEKLFGETFQALFVFLYWCEGQPPDGLFQEVFTFQDRWYIVRAVRLADYRRHMKVRSEKWKTVDLPAAAFREVSCPFCPPAGESIGGDECDDSVLQPL